MAYRLYASLSRKKGDHDVEFPAVNISDSPRFAYRGAMLDVSRHFFPVDSVKKFIDMLALHNINRFHWHLSEDQGWRIEIKEPSASCRNCVKAKGALVWAMISRHPTRYLMVDFYTQDEAREIVKGMLQTGISLSSLKLTCPAIWLPLFPLIRNWDVPADRMKYGSAGA